MEGRTFMPILFIFITIILFITLYVIGYMECWDEKIKKINFKLNLKSMNIKSLLKALRFACVPTMAILALVFFAIFDIQKTVSFITSQDGWAVFIRIVSLVAELLIIAFMYVEYEKEESVNRVKSSIPNLNKDDSHDVGYHTSLYNLNAKWTSSDTYKAHYTNDSDIMIIVRTPKSKN